MAATIDEYLEDVPARQREALERLREQIHAAAPEAEECISYGIPAFRQGEVLCGFAAMKKHCGFYVFAETTIGDFADELTDFEISTGTIRFQPDHPIPEDLVTRMVKARIDEVSG
jgi:uncharacterized protein YdhG (YjbR/CyaY superfamily)